MKPSHPAFASSLFFKRYQQECLFAYDCVSVSVCACVSLIMRGCLSLCFCLHVCMFYMCVFLLPGVYVSVYFCKFVCVRNVCGGAVYIVFVCVCGGCQFVCCCYSSEVVLTPVWEPVFWILSSYETQTQTAFALLKGSWMTGPQIWCVIWRIVLGSFLWLTGSVFS